MRQRKPIALICALTLIAGTTVAQQSSPTNMPALSANESPLPSAINDSGPAKAVLKEGTEVDLKFAQSLSSKRAAVGDQVQLVLDQDVKAGDVVVVRRGAPASGTVTNAKKAGMMGRGGELSLRVDYLKAGDSRVPLRGMQGKQGADKDGVMVGMVVAFGVIGFMKHGKQAEVKEGTPLKAYVDKDVELVIGN